MGSPQNCFVYLYRSLRNDVLWSFSPSSLHPNGSLSVAVYHHLISYSSFSRLVDLSVSSFCSFGFCFHSTVRLSVLYLEWPLDILSPRFFCFPIYFFQFESRVRPPPTRIATRKSPVETPDRLLCPSINLKDIFVF